MASLRSCLQKVQKHRAHLSSVTASVSTSTPPEPGALKASLAQARELAAKVQRHQEAAREGQNQHPDAEARER